MAGSDKPMGWGMIVAILVGVGLVVGFGLGLLGEAVDLPSSMSSAGVGVVVGIVGALLIGRRRRALAAAPTRD